MYAVIQLYFNLYIATTVCIANTGSPMVLTQ